MKGLIDSHCHLPLVRQQIPLETILENARQAVVSHMLCVAIDFETLPEILELAHAYDNISASAGLHPNHEVKEEPSEAFIIETAQDDNIVAIGETGLDYYRSEGDIADLAWQCERFRTHIRAAKHLKKPLIIHTRNAKEDVIKILQEENADTVGGVMHCFVEDIDTANAAMELGFYISFSGIVTFKNATDLHEVVRHIPLDRLLIETDSPYLAPVPYRGKPNQPSYVYYVAECIATLRGIEVEEVGQVSTENFFSLFRHAVPATLS